MDALIKIAWAALALVHIAPAAVVFAPGLVQGLYGVDARGSAGLLLTHRGALFLAVVAVCTLALFDPSARRAGSLVAAISVVGFLVVYARAGFPAGSLRTIAWADVVALAPLALVTFEAWLARRV